MNNKRVLSKVDLGSFIKPNPYKKDIIYDPRGQWDHPGENTRIPGGDITMQGVDYPVWAQPSVGPGTMMQPGQDYTFPGAEYVDEYPQMKKGGSKKKSSKYTRNIFATNKLFAESYLFKKPKKHQIFDPNASFYQDGGEANDYIETELTDDEIQAYRDGGYVVEESNDYKKGGALLTKKVTCKKCGWTWDAADGGDDVTTCHKCGGQGLVHAKKGGAYYDDSRDAWVSADGTVGPNGPANYKDGGENNYYSVKGSPGVYRKVNGKWEVDFNRSGNFQPLSKGDVAARTAVLNKQAKQMFDPMYDDMVNTKKSEYKEVPKQPAPIKKPKAQDKKAQEVFNKDFKITDESKAEKIKNEIEEDKKRFIENAKKEGYEASKEDLDNIEERGWNIYGNVGVTYDPGTIKEAPLEEKPQGLLDKAGDIISNPMTAAGFLMRGQGVPDYMQRDMDRGTFGYYSNGAFHTERNPLDFAVSDMTPLGLVSDARAVNSGIENGNATQAGLGLLSFIPGFGEAKKTVQAVNTAANTVDAVHDASRAIDFTGPLKHNYQDVPEVLTGLRQRGNYWDKSGIKGEDLLHPDMINYHGTYSGRPLVEVKMPDGSSEMFYKSSGWAGKQGNAANGTTEGMWQVFGGHSDTPQISNWFIKDKDYQNYYGSNTFGTMAGNMDKALMQKHGLKSVDELDNVLNFQERLSKINSYTPPKKKGGTSNNYIELELTPEEIQEYAKGGFIVEDISVPSLNQAQEGGENPVPLDPHQVFLKNWYENRVFPKELEKARPILLEQLSKPFPEYVPTDRLPADAVAAYNYDDNIVETNKNYPAELIEGSKTHEDNHYVTRDANEYLNGPHGHLVEQNIIKPKDINTGNPEWDKAYKKNFEDIVAPEEMHSRIMTFRELAGFKPNQVITEKDVEDYFKKAGDMLDPDIQDIKQVTKGTKSIVELLNYMASNDGPSKDNIMDYAKNGGIVTSLTQKQINQYIKNGYIVESLD
jgi:hypothetical protein